MILAPGDSILIVLRQTTFSLSDPLRNVPRLWVWEYQWLQHHGPGQQQQQQQLLQLQSRVFPMLLHEWLKKNKETSSRYSTNSWPSAGNERDRYDGAPGLLSWGWPPAGDWRGVAQTHRLEWKLYMWSHGRQAGCRPDQRQIWNSICDGVHTFKDGLRQATVSWWTLDAGLDQLPLNFFHKTEIMQPRDKPSIANSEQRQSWH